jgi:hypothetical protein
MKVKTMNLSFYIAFILSIGVVFLLAYINSDEKKEGQYVQVEITKNETIWGIAESRSDLHELSTLEFVEWVEKKNGIDADDIYTGLTITLPIEQKDFNDAVLLVAGGELQKP